MWHETGCASLELGLLLEDYARFRHGAVLVSGQFTQLLISPMQCFDFNTFSILEIHKEPGNDEEPSRHTEGNILACCTLVRKQLRDFGLVGRYFHL